MCRNARALTGLSNFQLRWYDRQGLLGEVERTDGGWRVFSREQLETLQRIAEWRREGLSIQEIRVLLGRDHGGVARAILKRREELAHLVRIIDRLEQEQTALEARVRRLTR